MLAQSGIVGVSAGKEVRRVPGLSQVRIDQRRGRAIAKLACALVPLH